MHGAIDTRKEPLLDESQPTQLGVIPLLLVVCIITLTGTYFRIRIEAEGPTLDWLVVAQLIACSLGGMWGVVQMVKTRQLGVGAKTLLVCLLGFGISCIFSQFGVMAFGYWILLAGSGLLMIGLVGKARSEHDLQRILNLWLVVVAALLLKDTIQSFLLPESESGGFDARVFRLGSNTTAPNEIGLTAAVAFGLTLKRDAVLRPLYLWLPRLLFVLVILLSRSRVSIVALMGGLLAWFLFRQFFGGRRRWALGLAVPSIVLAAITLWVFFVSLGSDWALDAYQVLNRGQQKSDVVSLTGRTKIWKYGLERVIDSPMTIFFGHGYGISKMIYQEGQQEVLFYAQNSHNSLLEAMVGTGLIGTVPFVLMLVLGGIWIFRFQKLGNGFSADFRLQAVFIILIIYISSITEALLSTKVNPKHFLFFLFLLAADKFRKFSAQPRAAQITVPKS